MMLYHVLFCRKSIMFALLLILFSSTSWAATINCSGTLSDCQTKVTNASAGDVITVGTSGGSYTWSGTLTMKAGVTLQGFGVGYTTVTTSDGIVLATQSGVKGIDLRDNGSCYTIITTPGTDTSDFVVANNKITTAKIAFRVSGGGNGVFSSNEVHCSADDYSCVYLPMEATSGSWSAIDFGSSSWVFIEGNTFYNSGSFPDFIETHYDNSKAVQRYNTYREEDGGYHGAIVEAHNDGSAPSPTTGGGGTRAREAYNELVVFSTSGVQNRRIMNFRMGTGIFYNWVMDTTAISGNNYFDLELHNYRTVGGINHDDNSDGDMCDAMSTENTWYSDTFTARCCSTSYSTSVGGHTVTGEGYSVSAPCLGTGTGINRTREPLYFWNMRTKNGDSYSDITSASSLISSWGTSQWALPLNEMYYVNPNGTSKPTQLSSYSPYTCPHPLTGYTGTCDTNTAGTSGYNVSPSVGTITGITISPGVVFK
jgi:hypothetical protein